MSKIQLGDLQLAIMQVLWERGEASVVEVQGALRGDRELATTTIGTILSRLEKQHIVTHRSEGRQYVYRPCVSQQDARRSMVASLIDRLFQGDATALVSHLVKDADIDPDELERLRALLDRSATASEDSHDA